MDHNVRVYGDGAWWNVERQDARRLEVTRNNDNTSLGKRLRSACEHNVRLPSGISFTCRSTTVQMHLDSDCVRANMQTNAAAFEGWALALKRWLPDVAGVELSWDFDGNVCDPHYQRFLYRTKKFRSLFADWFFIAAPDKLDGLKTEAAGHEFILNVASKPRDAGECDWSESLKTSEYKLECHIVRHQEPLCNLLGVDRLDRQLPVGLFRNSVSNANEVFPGKKGAIDIWGVDKGSTTLFLFELKKEGNKPLGIMSELFFYSFVLADAQARRFKFEKPNPEIEQTGKIAAYILAPEWHPLIDEEMLKLVNEACSRVGAKIGFGAIKIIPAKVQKYEIVLRVRQ